MKTKQDLNASPVLVRDLKNECAGVMPNYETELEMLRLHIREGDININHKRARIASFARHDLSVSIAEAMLDIFSTAQAHRLQQLKRLLSLH